MSVKSVLLKFPTGRLIFKLFFFVFKHVNLYTAKGPFGGNVFKNPARYIYMKSSRPFAASHSGGTKPPCWREGGVLREEKK